MFFFVSKLQSNDISCLETFLLSKANKVAATAMLEVIPNQITSQETEGQKVQIDFR